MAGNANNYARAGVDLEGVAIVKEQIKTLVQATHDENVLGRPGLFAALYRIGPYVFAASVDGVGTKLKIAQDMGANALRGVGRDLVNHCVNDILCQGARPVFFMDYFAQDRLREGEVLWVIEGVVEACLSAGINPEKIPLIGGETAQMLGVFKGGQADLVGFILGLVEEDKIIDGAEIKPGDKIIGLPSLGLHTNGYSLARRIVEERVGSPPDVWTLDIETDEFQGQLGQALLQPHKNYLRAVFPLLEQDFGAGIHGIAHITGGGLPGNIDRVLPPNCQALIRLGSWPVLPIFQYIQRLGDIPATEMYQVFNMGIGMVLIVSPDSTEAIFGALADMNEPAYLIGEIAEGRNSVNFYSLKEDEENGGS